MSGELAGFGDAGMFYGPVLIETVELHEPGVMDELMQDLSAWLDDFIATF